MKHPLFPPSDEKAEDDDGGGREEGRGGGRARHGEEEGRHGGCACALSLAVGRHDRQAEDDGQAAHDEGASFIFAQLSFFNLEVL